MKELEKENEARRIKSESRALKRKNSVGAETSYGVGSDHGGALSPDTVREMDSVKLIDPSMHPEEARRSYIKSQEQHIEEAIKSISPSKDVKPISEADPLSEEADEYENEVLSFLNKVDKMDNITSAPDQHPNGFSE